MGIDMIMNILLFWAIWKFLWKKSRTKHMYENGFGPGRDAIAYVLFVVAVVFFTFGPYLIAGGATMAVPFIVFGGIFAAYAITVRIPLGAVKEDVVDTSRRIDRRG